MESPQIICPHQYYTQIHSHLPYAMHTLSLVETPAGSVKRC